ncbi:MAG: zinc-ribbon domain-containing protein [Clostridiales bacterium]|nr:zinc-ribbon domain-containing protein [Clostridiales bacterium]
MICTHCGAQNPDNAQYCIDCRARLVRSLDEIVSSDDPVSTSETNSIPFQTDPSMTPNDMKSVLSRSIFAFKIIVITIVGLFILAFIFSPPPFPASDRDDFINKASFVISLLVAFIFPIVMTMIPSLRRKIPFLKKNKIGYSILLFVICFVLGLIILIGMGNLFSDEYMEARTQYLSEDNVMSTHSDVGVPTS